MIHGSTDHDMAVAQDTAADVAMDDHPAGEVAAASTDVYSARPMRSGSWAIRPGCGITWIDQGRGISGRGGGGG